MKEKIPETIFGINIEEAYKNYLRKPKDETPKQETHVTIQDSSQFKLHEQKINDNEHILLNENTGALISIDKFHHNKDWNQMHQLLQNNNEYMPNLMDIALLSKLLLERKAKYADGSLIKPEEQERIFNEMYEVRNPWRAEYIDAKFKKENNNIYILYNHIIQIDNSLKPSNMEKLENTLIQDKTPGINLNEWIMNPNSHGLPRENIQNGTFYYWYPKDSKVAWLYADSVGALLDCIRGSAFSYGVLGVRKKFFHRK